VPLEGKFLLIVLVTVRIISNVIVVEVFESLTTSF